jgi:hypothetical protein
MIEFIETYHLDVLALGALLTVGIVAGAWIYQLITQMTREPERMRAAQDWASVQIEARLLDADAQLELAQRRFGSTILAGGLGPRLEQIQRITIERDADDLPVAVIPPELLRADAAIDEAVDDALALIGDARQHLNRADLVVLAMRDGRIAADIGPDGERVFEIRKERPA